MNRKPKYSSYGLSRGSPTVEGKIRLIPLCEPLYPVCSAGIFQCGCEGTHRVDPRTRRILPKESERTVWAGGNLNQVVKRANELAVAWLLAPSYIQEIVLPTIRETQETMNRIKRDLELITLKCIKNKTLK